MVHWCCFLLIGSSEFLLSHRKTAGTRHRLFLFLFMDKKSQQIDMVKHMYIYICIKPLQISRVSFSVFFFVTCFFSNWWPTGRFCLTARILKHQTVQKNSGSMALRLHSLTSTRSKSASDAPIFLGQRVGDEELVWHIFWKFGWFYVKFRRQIGMK